MAAAALIPAAEPVSPTATVVFCQSIDEVLGGLMVALTLAHSASR